MLNLRYRDLVNSEFKNMKINKEDNKGNKIPEIAQDDLLKKDANLQKILLEDSLKVFEEKAQNLVMMFDSPKMFKLQSLYKHLNKHDQRAWNTDLEQIIVALFYLGKHITKGLKVDLHSMGVRDTSFLVKKAGKCYDEALTFQENEFLLK